MRGLVVLAIALMLTISAVGIVAGLHTNDHRFVEDFEDGSYGEDWNVTDDSLTNQVDSTRAFNGSFSARIEVEVDGDTSGHVTSNFSEGVVNESINSDFNITYHFFRVDTDAGDFASIVLQIREGEPGHATGGNRSIVVRYNQDGLAIEGEKVVDNSNTSIGNPAVNEWTTVHFTGNSTHLSVETTDTNDNPATVVAERNGTVTPENTQLRLRFASGAADTSTPEASFDVISGLDTSAKFDSLELEVEGHMDHNTTQPYKVYKVEDDVRTEVTDEANVTSGNTSVITVDDAANELVATADESVNEQVEITAELNGTTTTENVTVANKTLNNMPILPPPTWPVAVIGVPGDTTGATDIWPGAVQLQWIFVSLALGALVANITHNSFIGTATVPMLLALGWAAEWISDAILILSVLFLLWITVSRGFGEIDPRTFKK